MQALKRETVIEKDGELVLHNLPYKKGENVELILMVESPLPSTRKKKTHNPDVFFALAGNIDIDEKAIHSLREDSIL